MRPLLYVITVNYNTADHTIEMVKSVKASNYDNLQIIIIDNASSYKDFKKLDKVKDDAIIIRSEENLGFSGGNNIGLRKAISDGAKYALLLNNDTTVDKDAISILVNYIENGYADVVCPNVINYAGGDLISYKGAVRINGIGEYDCRKYDEVNEITFAHGCCILASIDTWNLVGLMDEKYFLYFEDTALSAELLKKEKKMLYIPDAVIYHKESVSTKKFSDNYQYYFCRNRLLYIKEYGRYPMKFVAYIYTLLYMIKHLFNGNFNLNNVYKALISFIKNETGKRKVMVD